MTDKTNPPSSTGKKPTPSPRDTRQQTRAAALRANLRRRKAASGSSKAGRHDGEKT